VTVRAIWVDKDEAGYRAELRDDVDVSTFAVEGDAVDVDVEWSTLNYKDALAITGKGRVLRSFPLVPGIDLAGTVTASGSTDVAVGTTVLVTGYGLGETHHGGLAEQARVPAAHVVTTPGGLTTKAAMSIGTAGFTAMLCVQALERHGVTPADGDVLVTGAAGGVGSVAVMVLAGRGFRVVASSGRPELEDYLRSLGAAEVIDRAALSEPGRPLEKERWAGAVDTVGSQTLASVCAATKYRGTVAATGMAGGLDFPGSVAPFILRGVTLAGVDSVQCPMPERLAAWAALAAEVDPEKLAAMTEEIGLSQAIATCDALLAGRVKGRVVVDVAR
jgi:acrylyl-CoA reductase (NADPH)